MNNSEVPFDSTITHVQTDYNTIIKSSTHVTGPDIFNPALSTQDPPSDTIPIGAVWLPTVSTTSPSMNSRFMSNSFNVAPTPSFYHNSMLAGPPF